MRTRTLVLTIILACGGGFVALVAVVAGIVFVAYRNTDAVVSPKIDALFAAIQNDTFGNTYTTETAPEFRSVTSREQYEEIGQAVRTTLGSLRYKTLTQFNAQQQNAESYISVVYSALFEKGAGTIVAQFRSVQGQWRLVGFYVDSPKFLKELKTKQCPYCKQSNSTAAKFCANCGKAIADRDTMPPQKNGDSQPDNPSAKQTK